MNTIEALNKMKDVLMERGWTKRKLVDANGSVCLVGARNSVFGIPNDTCNLSYVSDSTTEALESVLPSSYRRDNEDDRTKIWKFNDTCLSVNEVLAVIDDAIIAEKEKGDQ